MPIKRNPILMIKRVKDVQFVDEFMSLNKNLIYQQPELLELIDWKISLKLNCINQYDTLFEELKYVKRKPELYDDRWKCNFCGIEEETYDHLWQCCKIKDVMQDITKKFKEFLVNIVIELSKDKINKD
ncbi:hypothetical protein RhiirA4_459856 [Rhizophagus irregularis]|uniref:Uncharacterized protein n=1 Tax=Rhizophagus irregularis TaxID=588596 RepID=A0A2I1GF99_9GLOM|nr:hypothetical protein RhiirA4_459856 [Rhizophagus irregularis]